MAFKKRYFSILEENAKFTSDTLATIPGLDMVVPQGTMYAMVRAKLQVYEAHAGDLLS